MPFWDKEEKNVDYETSSPDYADNFDQGEVAENHGHLHRRLDNRQIQLIAIGGSIGTALFVSIGTGLHEGGPASLFIAYSFYSVMLAFVNNCIAEMTILYPVSGGFVRLAGKFVDEALGFTAGWNFFFYEALLIPFEVSALTLVLGFWSDNIPPWSIPIACIVLYGLINCLAVKAYGEAEFWLSGGKVILILILFSFTFITMVGGNPQGDAYGFRHWESPPGAFAPYRTEGDLGRFEGFLACVWSACFTIVGPEYISMVAAEAKRPRIYIKNAFKTVYWRFGIFFILGALAVGIICPWNDPRLTAVAEGETDGSSAAASPYVIAMVNLKINVLPHIVNALMVTSIFSAGNTYTYCATRTLYGLALEGRAPKVLRYCTKNGVPIWCFIIVMAFPCLAFLQCSKEGNNVLTWLTNIITAGSLIDFLIMSVTYICFWRAVKAQGVDRNTFPYKGWFQPYSAYIGATWMFIVVFVYGYTAFKPWSVEGFFTHYTMVLLAPILFCFWKIVKKTKFVKPMEVDLIWERPEIDAYEASILEPPVGFWTEMIQLVGIKRNKGGNDKRDPSISQVSA